MNARAAVRAQVRTTNVRSARHVRRNDEPAGFGEELAATLAAAAPSRAQQKQKRPEMLSAEAGWDPAHSNAPDVVSGSEPSAAVGSVGSADVDSAEAEQASVVADEGTRAKRADDGRVAESATKPQTTEPASAMSLQSGAPQGSSATSTMSAAAQTAVSEAGAQVAASPEVQAPTAEAPAAGTQTVTESDGASLQADAPGAQGESHGNDPQSEPAEAKPDGEAGKLNIEPESADGAPPEIMASAEPEAVEAKQVAPAGGEVVVPTASEPQPVETQRSAKPSQVEVLPQPLPEEDVDQPNVRWSLLKSAAGQKSARVQLDHPTLGALRLDFAIGEGEIDVRVLAPSLVTAIRLERDAERIRALLQEHNVRLANLQVDVDRPERRQPDDRAAAQTPSGLRGRLSLTA